MFKPEEVFFDLETAGLLAEATTIHLLVVKCVTTRETRVYRPTHGLHVYKRPSYPLEEGLEVLAKARMVIGC